MALSPGQQSAQPAARATRRPLHEASVIISACHRRLILRGDLRIRLEEREPGQYFAFEIDRNGKRQGAGVPATLFMVALWKELEKYV